MPLSTWRPRTKLVSTPAQWGIQRPQIRHPPRRSSPTRLPSPETTRSERLLGRMKELLWLCPRPDDILRVAGTGPAPFWGRCGRGSTAGDHDAMRKYTNVGSLSVEAGSRPDDILHGQLSRGSMTADLEGSGARGRALSGQQSSDDDKVKLRLDQRLLSGKGTLGRCPDWAREAQTPSGRQAGRSSTANRLGLHRPSPQCNRTE